MNSEDLEKLLRRNSNTAPYFSHVYVTSDLFHLTIPRVPCCFIVNDISTSEINQGVVGHFIAFYVTDVEFYFIDSFGRSLSDFPKPIVHFVGKNSKHKRLVILDKQYQSNSSCVCSLFCLYILNGLCQGCSLNSLISRFNASDFHVNDMFLIDWFSYAYDISLTKRIRRQLLHCM